MSAHHHVPLAGEIVLRQFDFDQDYDEVITLWENAGPGIHVRRSDQPDQIAKKLLRDPDLFLVAEVMRKYPDDTPHTKIIGAVLGGFDGRRGMVYHLAVSPEFQRLGVGRLLMDELERRLRQKGCIRYYLLVTNGNETAIRFYERRGMERMDLQIFGKDLD